MSVRFRVYGCERMRRQRLIGECIVSFSNINLQLQSNMWVPLEPKANTVVCTSLYIKVRKCYHYIFICISFRYNFVTIYFSFFR